MKPVLLIVLDGWGVAKNKIGNAIKQTKHPFWDKIVKENFYSEVEASGKQVGLLSGNIGNSEVGHLHIGAGRLVEQDLVRIHKSIDNGSFYKNKTILKAIKHAKNSKLHILGLVSDAGVHSHIKHMFAIIDLAKKHKLEHVHVHAILDGRDEPPRSAKKYLEKLERKLPKNWKIATIMGRYYAMDRDNRWGREHKAYDAMVHGKGFKCKTWQEGLKKAYERGESDEFVKPTIVSCANVEDGDSIIFTNFRSDRAREITKAFVQGKFKGFKRRKILDLKFVCLVQYDKDIEADVAFKPIELKNTIGEVIAKKGLRQLRVAETEKWAHVTYFFNGLSGKKFKKEKRVLIPSSKVATYDKKPEMSAVKITKVVEAALKGGKYPFILMNYANADMVGHTGKINETKKAIRAIDQCLKKVVTEAKKQGYVVVITADHGNAEQLKYKNGSICTAHTTNKVPLIVIGDKIKAKTLYEIAPGILKIMGIRVPREMSKR